MCMWTGVAQWGRRGGDTVKGEGEAGRRGDSKPCMKPRHMGGGSAEEGGGEGGEASRGDTGEGERAAEGQSGEGERDREGDLAREGSGGSSEPW